MFALEFSDFNYTHDYSIKPLHPPSARGTLCFMWNLDITPSDRSLFTSISLLELTITNLNFLKFLKLPCVPVHVHHSESYSLVTQPIIHTCQSQTSDKPSFLSILQPVSFMKDEVIHKERNTPLLQVRVSLGLQGL